MGWLGGEERGPCDRTAEAGVETEKVLASLGAGREWEPGPVSPDGGRTRRVGFFLPSFFFSFFLFSFSLLAAGAVASGGGGGTGFALAGPLAVTKV